jgi:chemotaxis protein MotA
VVRDICGLFGGASVLVNGASADGRARLQQANQATDAEGNRPILPGGTTAPERNGGLFRGWPDGTRLAMFETGLFPETQTMRTPHVATVPPYARGPVVGAVFGLVMLVSPIAFSGNGFLMLFGLTGLIIVGGGVIATAFMSFSAIDVRCALHAIPAMLRHADAAPTDLRSDMTDIIHWARQIRPNGVNAIRGSLDTDSVRYPFINYGLNMVLSEYRPEDVRAMMETAAEAAYDRDCVPVDVLRAMTSHAPAFGMVGTLIGMIVMLCELGDNISNTGAALAVAFLSTLYGVVSARMIYMPAAARLQQQLDDRHRRHALVTEGMVMLAGGETPSHIQDRLNGFLRPEQRDYFDVIGHAAEPAFTAGSRALLPAPRLVGAVGT